jgi:hypothetical protein
LLVRGTGTPVCVGLRGTSLRCETIYVKRVFIISSSNHTMRVFIAMYDLTPTLPSPIYDCADVSDTSCSNAVITCSYLWGGRNSMAHVSCHSEASAPATNIAPLHYKEQPSRDHYTRLNISIKDFLHSVQVGFRLPLPLPSSRYYVTGT